MNTSRERRIAKAYRLWERWNRINVAVARTALEALESVIGFAIVAAVLLAPLLVCLAAAKYLFGS